MRLIQFPLIAAALCAALPLHAANLPDQQQIQAAVDAGIAKRPMPMPLTMRVTSVLGCQPSPEVPEEVVCLIGMSAGLRDGYLTVALRQENGVWSGVERKQPQYPGPTPEQAQALMRGWAQQQIATDAEAAKDQQLQLAATTMQIKELSDCDVERQSGHLQCEVKLSVPDHADIDARFKFALEAGAWRFLPPR